MVFHLEEAFTYLGSFGRYQKIQYFLLVTPGIFCGLHMLEYVFIGQEPPHRCYIPGVDNVSSPVNQSIIDRWIPKDDKCHIYVNEQDPTRDGNATDDAPSVECDRWVYDRTELTSTLAMKWDTVCPARKHLYTTVLTVQMAGVLFGAIGFGALSDWMGRKKVAVLSMFLQVFSGVATLFAPEAHYVVLLIVRFIMGTTTMGVFLVSFVLVMEIVGVEYRTMCGVLFQFFFAIGLMWLALLAYLIRDWFYLEMALTLPGVIFFSYIWLVNESPRWLMANNRPLEAEKIMKEAARISNVELPEEIFQEIEHQPVEEHFHKGTLLDLLRTPNLRKKSILIFFNWFVVSLVYYGLSINSTELVGSVYLNFFLSGLVELPGYIICIFSMDRWGRRLTLCATEIIGGIACIAAVFINKDSGLSWLTNTLSLTGKMMIAGSFAVIYNFSAELFPTIVRNNGMGASSMCARIGSMLAPNIVLINIYIPGLATVMFGIFSLLAGLSGLVLPETLGAEMPETLADGEHFGKDFDLLTKCRSRGRRTAPPEGEGDSAVPLKDTKPVNGDDKNSTK